MRIEFNKTGAQRKELVKAISEITGAEAVYKFMPTCAYEIDYFTVTKDGALEFDDRADSEEIENLLEQLAQRGFEGIGVETPDTAVESRAENVSEETEKTPCAPTEGLCAEPAALTVTIPLDCVEIGNLTKLLDAKGTLIKKALGVDDLKIEQNKDVGTVSFPWFSEVTPD